VLCLNGALIGITRGLASIRMYSGFMYPIVNVRSKDRSKGKLRKLLPYLKLLLEALRRLPEIYQPKGNYVVTYSPGKFTCKETCLVYLQVSLVQVKKLPERILLHT
jgi:hypothetical protein